MLMVFVCTEIVNELLLLYQGAAGNACVIIVSRLIAAFVTIHNSNETTGALKLMVLDKNTQQKS